MLGSRLFRLRLFAQITTRSNATRAPNPATEPTATPATAPELSPEPLLSVFVDALSAAAVASGWPTVTV